LSSDAEARARALAAAGVVLTVLFWGTQLPLSAHVLQSIDQYWFGVSRYGVGVALFAATLVWREGAAAFATEGRAAEVVWRGFCGFTVFGLVVFWALYYTSPTHVSIILALQPMEAALWLWWRGARRPARHTFVCMACALGGLVLLITRGDPLAALSAGSLKGDVMAFVGGIGWLIYTLGAQRFAGWSPLRYTTLTCLAGTCGIAVIAAVLTLSGLSHPPSVDTWAAQAPAILYIGIFPFYVAIFLFAIGVARLGAINTLLIGNATPVAVFAVDAALGRVPLPVEWLGAAIVVVALVANNLLDRRVARG
jgi:drug/metabolite transporter (DMT)-like permease